MNFYEKLCASLMADERLALATVVRTEGSVPRRAGAKMLINAQGLMLGTIGGGCPEAEASREALEVAEKGGCKICRIEMRHTKADVERSDSEEVLVCGGMQEVLLEPLNAGIPNGELLLNVLQSQTSGVAPCALVAVWIEEGEEMPIPQRCGVMRSANVQRFAVWSDGRVLGTSVHPLPDEWRNMLLQAARETEKTRQPYCQNVAMGSLACRIYAEPMMPELRLIVAGAGHVAVPLVRIAALCGYRVTVVDDRPEFATPERFPEAAEVLSVDFREYFSKLSIDQATSIVIITRGHRCDEQCLHAINGRKCLYLGMIGSHHRTELVRERLREMGYADSWIASLHAPIGLDIGAETPEEIAVAIVGEMIAQRNKK
ncbi:MAG: XdhC family protein [bacterium]|nr:XdhC family protein [bacterium]